MGLLAKLGGKLIAILIATAGVIVMDKSTDIVKAIARLSKFYMHESCGQCTPCREGTSWSERILTRIKHGKGRLKDLDILLDISESIGIMNTRVSRNSAIRCGSEGQAAAS